jgi:LysM repeat protein
LLYRLNNRATRVIFDLTVFTTSVVLPFTVQASFFGSVLGASVEAADATTTENTQSESIVDTHVLTSSQNPNPVGSEAGPDILEEDGALISTGPVGKDDISNSTNNSDNISVYTVRPGDSLSEIAQMFGVTANTILWANDLTKATGIKPGDNLIILPIAGTRHVVKSGDTIASIAKKYNGNVDEIISYNQLSSANDISNGDTIVVPGGEVVQAIHKPTIVNKVLAITKPKSNSVVENTPTNSYGGLVNPMPASIKTQGIHGHNGIDLGAPVGTPVRASASGVVIIAKENGGWNGGYGNYIVIKHSNGVQTLYAHLSKINVGVGQTVASAQNIAVSGNTGESTGPHLHFEVRGAKNPF